MPSLFDYFTSDPKKAEKDRKVIKDIKDNAYSFNKSFKTKDYTQSSREKGKW